MLCDIPAAVGDDLDDRQAIAGESGGDGLAEHRPGRWPGEIRAVEPRGGLDVQPNRRAKELLEDVRGGVVACGKKEKIPPPSLFRTMIVARRSCFFAARSPLRSW